ncbi:MAG: hypothetical protein RL318_295 [Fibrobacterota bacterium]
MKRRVSAAAPVTYAPALRIGAGEWKGRRIHAPAGLDPVRPSPGILKEALFSMLGAEITMGPFLDLYGGTGAVAFEALSRGAPSAVVVEKHRLALECIEETKVDLKADTLRIDTSDAGQYLAKSAGADFAVAFADPPFTELPDNLLERMLPVVRNGGLVVLQMPREHHDFWVAREDVKVRRYGASLLVVVRKVDGPVA